MKDMINRESGFVVLPVIESKVSDLAQQAVEAGYGYFGVAEAENKELLNKLGFTRGLPVNVFSFSEKFIPGSRPGPLQSGLTILSQEGKGSVIIPGHARVGQENFKMDSLDSVVAQASRTGAVRIEVPKIDGVEPEKVEASYLSQYEQHVLRSQEAGELLKAAGALVYDSSDKARSNYETARAKYRQIADKTKSDFVDSWQGVVDASGERSFLPGAKLLTGITVGMAAGVPVAEAVPAIIVEAHDLAEQADNSQRSGFERQEELGAGNFVTINDLFGKIGAVRMDNDQVAVPKKAIPEKLSDVKSIPDGGSNSWEPSPPTPYPPTPSPESTGFVPAVNPPVEAIVGAGGAIEGFTSKEIDEIKYWEVLKLYKQSIGLGAEDEAKFVDQETFYSQMNTFLANNGWKVNIHQAKSGEIIAWVSSVDGSTIPWLATELGALADVVPGDTTGKYGSIVEVETGEGNHWQPFFNEADGYWYMGEVDAEGNIVGWFIAYGATADNLDQQMIEVKEGLTAEDLAAMTGADRLAKLVETFGLSTAQAGVATEIETGVYKIPGASAEQDRYFDLVTGSEIFVISQANLANSTPETINEAFVFADKVWREGVNEKGEQVWTTEGMTLEAKFVEMYAGAMNLFLFHAGYEKLNLYFTPNAPYLYEAVGTETDADKLLKLAAEHAEYDVARDALTNGATLNIVIGDKENYKLSTNSTKAIDVYAQDGTTQKLLSFDFKAGPGSERIVQTSPYIDLDGNIWCGGYANSDFFKRTPSSRVNVPDVAFYNLAKTVGGCLSADVEQDVFRSYDPNWYVSLLKRIFKDAWHSDT